MSTSSPLRTTLLATAALFLSSYAAFAGETIQMFDGKFNIAEFTRILADGEVRHALPRGEPAPNQLSVRVLRAKNLAPAGLKKTADPYVVVRARRQSLSTHTQNHTLNPMWNEELVLNVEGPLRAAVVACLPPAMKRDFPQFTTPAPSFPEPVRALAARLVREATR